MRQNCCFVKALKDVQPARLTIYDMEKKLTQEVARELLTQLFETQAKWERSAVVKEVEIMHIGAGGVITAVSVLNPVKKALGQMKADGQLISIGKGLYAKSERSSGAEVAVSSSGLEPLGVPLQPVYARQVLLKLLRERPIWQRIELCKRLQADHVAAGNFLGNQDPLVVTKKALTYLRDSGSVQTDGRGNWSLTTNAQADESSNNSLLGNSSEISQATPALEKKDDRIELGEGAESVYLYYYETEKELALLKGQRSWQCKIGRTSGDVDQRVLAQAKTGRSKPPIVAVVIRSDYAAYLEQVIHNSFKMIDRHIDSELGGVEWFDTNPEQLATWWKGYVELFSRLTP